MEGLILSALQPGYLPWLGFFDLMKRCDVFVIEDTLQYTKQDWRNRNRIRTANGWSYLTVPVKKGPVQTRIKDVQIDNSVSWGRRHLNLLHSAYRTAPYWKEYAGTLEDALLRRWDWLLDVDLWFIEFLAHEFQIDTPRILLSSIPVEFGPDKTASLVELTRSVGADTFLEGKSGMAFAEESQFHTAGLKVVFQDYECRPYRQQFAPFCSHLSAIDLLLNEGPQGADMI